MGLKSVFFENGNTKGISLGVCLYVCYVQHRVALRGLRFFCLFVLFSPLFPVTWLVLLFL